MSSVRTVPARWRCQRAWGELRRRSPQLAGDVEFHLQGRTLEPDEEFETKTIDTLQLTKRHTS